MKAWFTHYVEARQKNTEHEGEDDEDECSPPGVLVRTLCCRLDGLAFVVVAIAITAAVRQPVLQLVRCLQLGWAGAVGWLGIAHDASCAVFSLIYRSHHQNS